MPEQTLTEGQAAPTFELPDHTGKLFRLQDQRGSWVVLWWYPKALTGG
jgi:peroxiredoxin Q/BCP